MNLDHPLIKKALAEDSSLFEKEPVIEDTDELVRFGIYIPGKETFPLGFLKLFPEEFIVEEISQSGTVITIDRPQEQSSKFEQGSTGIYRATLVKCGLSTLEAVRDISTRLNIDMRDVGYAGIKDKYAITAQEITIRNASIEAIKSLSSGNYFLKDIRPDKGMLMAGALTGNRFSLFVRTENGISPETFTGNKEEFFNYFYLQRFGSPRYINFEWGYDILCGNYEKTIESLLFKPAGHEINYVRKLREKASQERSWSKIREIFEPVLDILHSERPVIEHLSKHPTDFRGALGTIPDQVQLWLYALASLMWNEKISGALRNGFQLPPELPFFLSNKKEDIDLYAEELRGLGIYPPPFQNLRPFPHIRLSHRTAPVIEQASNIAFTSQEKGFRLSFELSKGSYATTFLSHHINIVSEAPTVTMSQDRLTAREVAEDKDRIHTIESFQALSLDNRE
ncbi:MAG TPA: tRNA pseudouridine(13) synthase TruD [Candidatus Paceibacterota bacterium]|jgi:Uncharacterized conserved protein